MRDVRRSTSHDALVRCFTEARHPSSGRAVFPTIREFQCFAAVVGYQFGQRHSLAAETREIPAKVFEQQPTAIETLYLIAVVESRDSDILRIERENDAVKIFEEYAEAGLRIIAGWLREEPDDAIGDKAILMAFEKHGLLTDSDGMRSALGRAT